MRTGFGTECTYSYSLSSKEEHVADVLATSEGIMTCGHDQNSKISSRERTELRLSDYNPANRGFCPFRTKGLCKARNLRPNGRSSS